MPYTTIEYSRYINRFCLLFLMLLGYIMAYGNQNTKPPTTPILKKISTQNGLQSDQIQDIIFDALGFLWIASDRGLMRFDGYNFEYFSNTNHPSFFRKNKVNSLIRSEEYIYAISDQEGVIRIHIHNLSHIETIHTGAINGIKISDDYNIEIIEPPNTTKQITKHIRRTWTIPHLEKKYKIDSTGNLWVREFKEPNPIWKQTQFLIPSPLVKIITNSYQNAHFIATKQGLYWLSEQIKPSQYYYPKQKPEIAVHFSKVNVKNHNEIILGSKIININESGSEVHFNPKKDQMKIQFSILDYTLFGSYYYTILANDKTIEQTHIPEFSPNSTFKNKIILEVLAEHSFENGSDLIQENFLIIKTPSNLLLNIGFIFMTLCAIVIITYFYFKKNKENLESEEKIKEIISMDLHDELGTLLTRTLLRVRYLSGPKNPALSALKHELNTSIQALKNFILVLSRKNLTQEHINNYCIDKVSVLSQKHDIETTFLSENDTNARVSPDALLDCNFCVNEICYIIAQNNHLRKLCLTIVVKKKFISLQFKLMHNSNPTQTKTLVKVIQTEHLNRIKTRLSSREYILNYNVLNNSELIEIDIRK